MPIRLVLADDHPLILDGLENLFQLEKDFQVVARGLRNKEIADKLFISEGTVKVHLHNIYEKLKVDNRLALFRYAQGKGLF